MTIQAELQKSSLPSIIELFRLDLTSVGEGMFYFTPHTVNGTSNVSFGGQVYLPMPIKFENYTQGVGGASPQPILRVSNITRFLQFYLAEYKDLVGKEVMRTVTMEKFLDSGSSPDSSQIISQQKFIINQKRKMTKFEIEFVLSSLLDSPNFSMPRGIVLRSEFPAAGLFRKG